MKSFAVLPLFSWLVGARVPYSEYVLTPKSRILRPVAVYNVNGTVSSPEDLITGHDASTTFVGASAVTYDFGKNIAGLVSFNVSKAVGSDVSFIGVSFTESSMWISSEGCDATANRPVIDKPLWYKVESNGHYAAEKRHQRGGFRFMNVYHNTTGNVSISDLTIYYTAIPHYSDEELAAGVQTGYFNCEDEQINRVWYAGAYTNQMCTIDPTAGDSLIYEGGVEVTNEEPLEWYNNSTISNGSAVLVDGAKRDRVVYSGDILVSQPGIFVSTYDMEMCRESLASLLDLQQPSGALPYSGRPLVVALPWSFTYHLHTLIDINQYYTYTGNETYLNATWPIFKHALTYTLSFMDSSGLADVQTAADWLRSGMGGHNIEANAILYHTLNIATTLATHLNDTSDFAKSWPKIAEGIKEAANERLWDPSQNLYLDNDDPHTTLHPQDGNTWAIISNLVPSHSRALQISHALEARWGPYGPPAPEAGNSVSPFISALELQAHYMSGRPETAIKLVKRMWGDFMLDDPRMTNSTFIEGYMVNGDIHYAPYPSDPRVSHAHGWSTGPTSVLTFYAAGLRVTEAGGKKWVVEPQLGGLKRVEAGYITYLGQFSSHVSVLEKGGLNVTIETPVGTEGSVRLRYKGGLGKVTVTNLDEGVVKKRGVMEPMVLVDEEVKELVEERVVSIDGLEGGRYTVLLEL